jgi:HK97 gp10 family phage protein
MAGSFASIKLYNGVQMDTSVLDRITAELKPKARKIVNKYGLAMASQAATVHPWKLQTGALTNSILSESKMTGDMTFTISDGVEYGVYLEFGASRMAAYPFMVPAIEAWRERFLAAFSECFK